MSYNEKHNDANGEDNRDGEDHNRSWNCGAEGATDDADVLALRGRQQRNLLATLLLSQGVPMILGGDELGRTQLGNNNAYCQDSPISWTDWQAADSELLAFVRRLVAFRRAHPAFRRSRFFQGRPLRGSTITDVAWLSPDATEMTDEQWDEGHAKSLAVYLNGSSVDLDRRGEAINDDSFLLFLNAHGEPVRFRVPDAALRRGMAPRDRHRERPRWLTTHWNSLRAPRSTSRVTRCSCCRRPLIGCACRARTRTAS